MLRLKTLPPSPNLYHSSLVYSLYVIIKHLTLDAKTPHTFKDLVQSKELCSEALDDVNISSSMDQLHKLINAEMVGENERVYEQFLVLNKKHTDAGNTQNNMKLIKAEIDLATIHAVANIFGLAIVILSSCREVPMLTIVPNTELRITSPCFLQYNPDTAIFTACIKDDTKLVEGNGVRTLCTCGSKSKNKSAKKMCTITRCRCYLSGKNCTSMCQCVRCGNHKPEGSIEPTPPKKPPGKRRQRPRPREYDFHSSALIADDLTEASITCDEESIIKPEAHIIHHAILDALMYSLKSDVDGVEEIAEFDLPDVLYGGYLSVCSDIARLDLPSSNDFFLQPLPELDDDFVREWISERKDAKSALEEMKRLSKCTGETGKTVDSLMVLSDDSSDEDVSVSDVEESNKLCETPGRSKDISASEEVGDGKEEAGGNEASASSNGNTADSVQLSDGNETDNKISAQATDIQLKADGSQPKSSAERETKSKDSSDAIPSKGSMTSEGSKISKKKELVVVLEDAIKNVDGESGRKRKCRSYKPGEEKPSGTEKDAANGDRTKSPKKKMKVDIVTKTASTVELDASKLPETLMTPIDKKDGSTVEDDNSDAAAANNEDIGVPLTSSVNKMDNETEDAVHKAVSSSSRSKRKPKTKRELGFSYF